MQILVKLIFLSENTVNRSVAKFESSQLGSENKNSFLQGFEGFVLRYENQFISCCRPEDQLSLLLEEV